MQCVYNTSERLGDVHFMLGSRRDHIVSLCHGGTEAKPEIWKIKRRTYQRLIRDIYNI